MGWIIVSVLVAVCTAGCIATLFVAPGTDKSEAKLWAGGIGLAVLVGWAVISGIISYNRVGQLQVGLVYNYSGTLAHATGHGNQWIAPWQSLKTENIGLQKEEFFLDENSAAVSADQQAIYADVQLNYEVEPSDVVALYKVVGPSWKDVLLEGRMLQDFKQVTSTFTAAQITTHRAQLRADAKRAMVGELQKYGIKVVDVLIKNLSYSAAYRDAIQQKTIQVQKALQAQAKVAQATAEANQAIATAKGKAQSNLLVAQAQAKALALKGKALHENPEVLQLEAIDKLNPHASVVICTGTGSGNCPSFLGQTAAGK